MHRSLFLSIASAAALLATTSGVASAQAMKAGGGIKLADVAGTWESKAAVGPNDSIVVNSSLTATADKSGWSMKFTSGNPVPVRVLAVAGDSVVTEAGPYPSILRPGQTVNLLHMVGHYKGNSMTGTFDAYYQSGGVIHGKIEATRAASAGAAKK